MGKVVVVMNDLTESEKRKFGDGIGGYSSRRDMQYQVSWREAAEQEQKDSKIERLIKQSGENK